MDNEYYLIPAKSCNSISASYMIYTDTQSSTLEEYGVGKIYTDVDQLLDSLSANDVVVVESLTKLASSIKSLVSTINKIDERGAILISLKEGINTNNDTEFIRSLNILAKFDKDVIVERTYRGLAKARARGRKGGRPKLPDDKVRQAIELYNTKDYSLREIENITGVSPTTLYRRLNGK